MTVRPICHALPWLAAMVLGACASVGPSSGPATPVPTTASVPASVTGSAPPGTPLTQPTLPPGQTPSPTGCGPELDVSGPWPSDRLVAVDVVTIEGSSEEVQFRFAAASGPGHRSEITIGETTGPFTNAGSGAPVDVAGSMFMQVHLEGLLLADEQGNATLQTPLDLQPGLIRVKQVVAIDASEGVMTWIIGSDFTCIDLRTEPANGLVAVRYSIPVP